MDSFTAQIRNYASINEAADEHLGFPEIIETNGAILMSLLEEFEDSEDRDEERLNWVIQSLEGEIINVPSTMDYPDSGTMDSESIILNDLWNSIAGSVDGQNCSVSTSIDFDQLGWFDMEQVACSPSHDMNWYIDSCEYEMDSSPTENSKWVGDYSHVNCGVGLEKEQVRSALWQENAYDSVMYD